MCRGSFFADWPYCLQCLFIHGLRSERDVAYYESILSTASDALCNVPTPTAQFASIFDSAQYVVATPITGNTASIDQAPGQTAVSLYFTATADQGPGEITGPATAATAPPRLFTAPGISTAVEPGPRSTGVGTAVTTFSRADSSSGTGSAKPTTTMKENGATIRRRDRRGFLMAIGAVAALVVS